MAAARLPPKNGREEKERFVQLMRLYEAFCGVTVRAYCVMSNHFHLLVEVPVRPGEGLTDREFLARLALLYRPGKVEEVRERLQECRQAGDTGPPSGWAQPTAGRSVCN